MKKIIFALALLLFATPAFAIGFDTDKSVYEKQETIKISGSCEMAVPATLDAKQGGLEIFSKQVECKDKSFMLDYKTSFLDHSGEWTLTLASGNEQVLQAIFVKEKREGGFFLVRFLSPAEGTYQKNQKIILSVEVIDAGNKIPDAQVVAWGAKGEKLALQNNGNGQYTLEYNIPIDAVVGKWPLEVLAESKKGEETFGGIGQLDLTIEQAPIIIEITEPKVSSFEQGDKINFEIIAKYSNGEPIKDGKIQLLVGEKIIEFEQKTLLMFNASLDITQSMIGAIEMEIKATDIAQNTSSKKLKMVISCSFTCLIKQYGLFAAAITLISLALARILLSRISFKSKRQQLEKEKEKISNLIKELQKEYFVKGVMPSASYKQNLSEYKSKLTQIDQELSELKSKEQEE